MRKNVFVNIKKLRNRVTGAIEIDQIQEGTIIRLNYRGQGLLKNASGRFLTVPNALPDEILRARIFEGKRRRQLGRQIKLFKPHPHRCDPECSQAPNCPGCSLRHWNYQSEIQWKGEQVQHILGRIAPGMTCPVEEIIPAQYQDGYRAKATAIPFRQDDRIFLGMRSYPWSDKAIDLSKCPVQDPCVSELLGVLAEDLTRLNTPLWDEEQLTHGLRWVLVHADGQCKTGHRVILVFSHPGETKNFCKQPDVLQDHPDVSILVTTSKPPSNKILRTMPESLRGELATRFKTDELTFEALPPTWTPVAPRNLSAIIHNAVALLQPQPDETILELGCGAGTVSVAMGAKGANVLGVDADRWAVQAARNNAMAVAQNHHRFQHGTADRAVRRLISKNIRANSGIVHSIRLPYGKKVLELLELFGITKILYISPTATSLARDLNVLMDQGFTVTRLIPVDQLARTAHVMTLTLLNKPRASTLRRC